MWAGWPKIFVAALARPAIRWSERLGIRVQVPPGPLPPLWVYQGLALALALPALEDLRGLAVSVELPCARLLRAQTAADPKLHVTGQGVVSDVSACPSPAPRDWFRLEHVFPPGGLAYWAPELAQLTGPCGVLHIVLIEGVHGQCSDARVVLEAFLVLLIHLFESFFGDPLELDEFGRQVVWRLLGVFLERFDLQYGEDQHVGLYRLHSKDECYYIK